LKFPLTPSLSPMGEGKGEGAKSQKEILRFKHVGIQLAESEASNDIVLAIRNWSLEFIWDLEIKRGLEATLVPTPPFFNKG
jgi:hypothetical protein